MQSCYYSNTMPCNPILFSNVITLTPMYVSERDRKCACERVCVLACMLACTQVCTCVCACMRVSKCRRSPMLFFIPPRGHIPSDTNIALGNDLCIFTLWSSRNRICMCGIKHAIQINSMKELRDRCICTTKSKLITHEIFSLCPYCVSLCVCVCVHVCVCMCVCA